MYVTRPLSLYRRDPLALSLPPPEGPNSGVLVVLDAEAQPTCCFGTCESNVIEDLPFPQNKNLTVEEDYPLIFIPVINQPLSYNQYYVIQNKGTHKGKALINSKEEDKEPCCFGSIISDKKPEDFDLNNMYQQFKICKKDWVYYAAKSVAADGYPPDFLRSQWGVEASSKHEFLLSEAHGVDANLRARLPDFSFPLSVTSSAAVVVGKWYSPFMFIKEGNLKDQVKNSRYYEITLDQRWEKIFQFENMYRDNSVTLDVDVEPEVVAVSGKEVTIDWKKTVNGVMWCYSNNTVGLSVALVERMRWEQERVGWISGSGAERTVKVKREEKFGGKGEWRKFGCYVLVERFLIKRTNGSLVMSLEFKHTNQIRTKWE